MPRLRRRLSYSEIADDIAARIARGEYEPGSRLPSYAQLADIYDVSYSTAARAVRVLRERGLIYGEPGRGLYVDLPEYGTRVAADRYDTFTWRNFSSFDDRP